MKNIRLLVIILAASTICTSQGSDVIAAINTPDGEGITPLLQAIIDNNIKVAQQLICLGADIKLKTTVDEITPAMFAAGAGRIKILDALLQKDKTITQDVDKKGRTPLHFAASNGNDDIVHLLVSAGADVKAIDSKGKTATDKASKSSHEHIRGILEAYESVAKNKKDGINTASDEGLTPIFYAIMTKNPSLVAELIHQGADVTAIAEDELTTLMFAAGINAYKIIKLLLAQHPSLLNKQDAKGKTALFYASSEGHREALTELLEAEADVNITNYKGQVAADKAFDDETKTLLTSYKPLSDYVKGIPAEKLKKCSK